MEGHCFLGKDAEWARQNYAQALCPNGIFADLMMLGTLDDERLRVKNEWMSSLGVCGIIEVNCRHQAGAKHQASCGHQSEKL